MNTQDIQKTLKGVKCFKGVYCRDNLPNISQRPFAIIANTDACADPGEHWIAIYINKDGNGEFFDSFGLPPLHSDFINFMNSTSPNGWTWNNKTLQSVTASTCGHYCVLFVKFKCRNDSNFYKLFTTNSNVNDALIKGYMRLYNET